MPAYAYVPGKAPHPFRHPDGHAYAAGRAPQALPWSPVAWQDDAAWLHGVDLFNHGYPWEAHEVWEGMWHQVPVDGPLRPLLQGLIQLAAARVHARTGRDTARLVDAACARLDTAHALGGTRIHGLCLVSTRGAVASWRAGGAEPTLVLERAA